MINNAKSAYNFSDYVSKKRWASYWHQIDEVIDCNLRSLLLIGKGDGIVADILEKHGIEVVTFDIDPDLTPDILGNVIEIKTILNERIFDGILCSEVLEHMPFEHFEEVIQQLKDLTKKYLILSLPLKYWEIKFALTFHRISLANIHIIIPKFTKTPPAFSGHYWEIGRVHSLKEIKSVLEKHFTIVKKYAVQEFPYHMFFLLEKKQILRNL